MSGRCRTKWPRRSRLDSGSIRRSNNPFPGKPSWKQVESAIARLKPDLRDTAVLIAGQQLSHAEAAQILGIAEATVSWRMHEIRRQLAANPGPDD